ncbi:MAG TPA: hypothetical protein VL485_27545 [Ktedonobacteraceae bacterium]|nr:hypothetical protein [Ktedonobacteraceae bacterium]
MASHQISVVVAIALIDPNSEEGLGDAQATIIWNSNRFTFPIAFTNDELLNPDKKGELDSMRILSENPTLVIGQRNEESTKIPFCDLFPPDLQLEWNTESRILSLLNIREPHILAQQQFTRNEWLLLMSLIKCYPHYTPHEMLLAELTLLSYDDWCQRLQKIRQVQPESIIQELKPVYRALSGVRTKLKKFYPQLKILLVRNMGYAISLAPARKSDH